MSTIGPLRSVQPILIVLCLLGALPGLVWGQDISKKCEAYLALADEPDLDGYPVFLRSVRAGRIKAVVAGEKPSRLSFDFSAMKERAGQQLLAKSVLDDVPGIWDVEMEIEFDAADVAEKQRESIRKACPSLLDVSTIPAGAEVLLDGRSQGTTPLQIETGAGSSDLVIRLTGHRTLRRKLRIEANEERAIRETLVALGALHVPEPTDAAILVDGEYVGAAPTTIYLDEGEHVVELVAPGFAPWDTSVELPLGDEATIAAKMRRLPPEQACYRFDLQGSAKDTVKPLRSRLVGERLQLAIPLYKVLTEVMENRVAVTHVLDGRRILFEPRTGDDYVDVPWKLLGSDLGGWDFGEVGTAIHHFPPEAVTITDIDDRKGRTIKIDLRYDVGEENSVYLDFTRKLRDVTAAEVEAALCRVFMPPLPAE
ncbi:MAG: PEGA domain-containing protein [Acidobacteriota bacterium]